MKQLQTLFDVRTQKRDDFQLVFANLEQQANAIKLTIEKLSVHRTAVRERMQHERDQAVFDPISRAALTDFLRASGIEIESLLHQQKTKEKELANALLKQELAREDLIEAQQKLMAIEKEIDKRTALKNKQKDRAQDAVMDEIAAKQWWEKS